MTDECEVRKGKKKLTADISLSIGKESKGAARFNVAVRRINRYQNYIFSDNKYTEEYILEYKLAVGILPHDSPLV